MAIILDATVGGANANSYLSLARANVLAETIPHLDFWLTDVDVDRGQLLLHATRLIDRCFLAQGSRAETSQALNWPRRGIVDHSVGVLLSHSAIPSFVEMATLEWAAALYQDPDPYSDVSTGLRRLETPSYRMEFTGEKQPLIPRVVSLLLGPHSISQSGSFHRVMRV